jgi:uncharacterized protein YoxC
VTDDTRDRDRPFADGGEPPETTSDGRSGRAPSFGRADRTPAGTAGSTRSASERSTGADSDGPLGEDPNAAPSAASVANPSAEPNGDRVEERLRAVERALTGTDDAVVDLGDEATASAERDELSARIDDIEARVEELEAATQAIRGYVGSIRSVNQAVERRADLALAKASESTDAAADDGSVAEDGAAANGRAFGDGATGGGTAGGDTIDDGPLGDGVPSEADLDAAVPADRRRGNGAESEPGSAVDPPETGGEGANDSWRAGALDRLRDSL